MSKSIDIPTHLRIERGAIHHLSSPDIYSWIKGCNVTVITGNGQTKAVTDKVLSQVPFDDVQHQVLYCHDNSLDMINQLERQCLETGTEVIIGIGGGKVLDMAKVVGTRLKAPIILLPTAISSDAICSPVAVIKLKDKRTSLGVSMPKAVLIDLDILVSSPQRLRIAGFGDLLSNKTAIFDWQLAHQANKDTMDTFASLMANNAVEAFLNTLNNPSLTEDMLLRVSAESLVMSGIAMSVAGSSRPCSGSEHLISHALDYYCGGKALHGEQVALGVLIAQYLQKEYGNNEDLTPIFQQLALPLHYEDLGYTKEEIKLAIRMAPKMRNRYTILNEFSLNDKQLEQLIFNVFESGHVQKRNKVFGSRGR
ncbi:3-dehydroquinate synthase [Caldalkalibacillus thermarum TA2.A1]|uniref:3-dehydroquinate synthase n=1 Tax=Caldalkalibacillus thermarum (strain TA2.A1) TaxID=986075 RepID=F5L988_CALTT|nr:iron-containing alcohol dehydrogenase family protein [Caldalkalibacillus thermarum]EGL82030.1 3-dehydroquinate synthase [Caldalkalibacillus thermarum TA2.A1]QZT34051.1 iron-containing alcohol dehydrogenase family protein [Caldalkalibacillus thermarum TA2.A1]